MLFDSAREVYAVCENFVSDYPEYQSNISYDLFLEFRSHVTDAWQFSRLYQRDGYLEDFSCLNSIAANSNDSLFAGRFFSSRQQLMSDEEWPKMIQPYFFLDKMRPLLMEYSQYFKIISTRNKDSINCILDYHKIENIEVFGQEEIKLYGSKRKVALAQEWFHGKYYVVYLDDMCSHLASFLGLADLCLHADWGYGEPTRISFSQHQALKLINGLFL